MYVVYVLDKEGHPLMPTTRFGKVRRMLRDGKAKAVTTTQFTIQLTYEPATHVTQPLHGGTDPGRTNIGEAVIDDKGNILYLAHVESRNKQVPELMAERRQHRQASRRGERLRRKRRAARNGTTTDFPKGRRLPSYADGVLALKDIINTESRFNNRKRPEGWVTPTVRHCIQTHVGMIRRICKILPVTDWNIEYNKFAFMQMEDPTIHGKDYQNGRLKGFNSMEDYVYSRQEGQCYVCGKGIEHYHHVKPRHEGGSNRPENIVGLCEKCHAKVHKGEVKLNADGELKPFAATSILNTAMSFIYDELTGMFGTDNIHCCSGYETSIYREEHDIPKHHSLDAACIAGIGTGIDVRIDDNPAFEVRQFRNHDRQLVNRQSERTYKFDGKVIAKNRSPRSEQKGLALSQWFEQMTKEHGDTEAEAMLSRLTVSKSRRSYNNPDRPLPGTIFMYNGKTYTLRGQRTNGQYFLAVGYGGKNIPARKCTLIYFDSLAYIASQRR